MPHQPVLVIIDVQERLFNVMDADHRDGMIRNIKILGATAQRLQVPVIVTEQYPRGLGRMLPELRELLDGVTPIEKTVFSCCGANGFTERLRAVGADPVILAGIEAHVCVLLTALDLIRQGFRVSVVADAVCSRAPANLELGLAQARQGGAVVTATETVVFELLGRADTDAFREISKLLR
jgi:nicotinamidase-related amidase